MLEAITGEKQDTSDAFALIEKLEKASGTTAPAQLKALKGATPRFTSIVSKDEMQGFVFDTLGIK